MKFKAFKKSALSGPLKAHAKGAAIAGGSIVDNENGTYTIGGLDAAGQPTDIESLATLTPPPTDSDTTVAQCGTPTGMTFPVQAKKPGVDEIALSVTFNAGTPAPLTDTAELTVTGGPAVGLTATLTINP